MSGPPHTSRPLSPREERERLAHVLRLVLACILIPPIGILLVGRELIIRSNKRKEREEYFAHVHDRRGY